MIITIDGPAASGKSTIARMVAEHLSFYYLNSGLLYRAVTYILIHNHQYTHQALQSVSQKDIDECTDIKRIFYSYCPQEGSTVLYDNKDITRFLKDPQIDQCVSIISPQKLVREALSHLQRAIADNHDVVVEGRDVGSVVFPDADYKFFLTASLEVRAERWRKYQAKKGNLYSLEEVKELIEHRDSSDKTREISPLMVPAQAITIDNSLLTLEGTMLEILKHVKN